MANTVGSRLKEERERLGLSQSEFAKLSGVHRNTLARYESGEREPDDAYLDRASGFGADYGYLIWGKRSDPASLYRLSTARVLPGIAEKAGLSGDALLDLLDLAAEEEADTWGATPTNAASPQWSRLIPALFDNGAFLAQAFKEVRTVAHERGCTLGCGKRAQAVLIIYEALKESGQIDRAFVEKLVSLAQG